MNTDLATSEPSDNALEQEVAAWDTGWDGYDHSITLHIPAMSAQYYRWENS